MAGRKTGRTSGCRISAASIRFESVCRVMSVGASGVARSTCHWRRRNVFVLSLGLIGPEGLWQPAQT
jgi:hypothetical protein